MTGSAPPAVVPAVAVDLPALETELEQTRARLARIIGAADAGLASVRRRARLRRAVALG